jgi:putative transposase
MPPAGRGGPRLSWEAARRCAAGISRSSRRYEPKPRAGAPALRQRRRDLAAERRRLGYGRRHVLVARDGIAVNHQRVERLDYDAGPTVRRRSCKRVGAANRTPVLLPTAPNDQGSLDVVSDALTWGRRRRRLAVVNAVTREAPAIEVDTSLPGERVVRVLEQLATDRGMPNAIVLDNGPDLTGRVLDHWAYGRGVQLRLIRPGTPVQNAFARASLAGCATRASTSTGPPASPP